jgi:hypothetical protein
MKEKTQGSNIFLVMNKMKPKWAWVAQKLDRRLLPAIGSLNL